MLTNLLLGLPTMAICLLLQSSLFSKAVHFYSRHENQVSNPSFWSSLTVVNGVMMLLILGNLAQLAIWASLFLVLDEFDRFGTAFYHSAVNFATLGYGDVVMSDKHRLLGPLEAINGVLMIGISTAALTAAFQDIMRKAIRAGKE